MLPRNGLSFRSITPCSTISAAYIIIHHKWPNLCGLVFHQSKKKDVVGIRSATNEGGYPTATHLYMLTYNFKEHCIYSPPVYTIRCIYVSIPSLKDFQPLRSDVSDLINFLYLANSNSHRYLPDSDKSSYV